MQSLSCGMIGTRVLTKEPKGKEISFDDRFFANRDFKNEKFRIKINSILMKESAEESDRTHDEVSRDRLAVLDSVIVRILKARKRMAHTALMAEVLQQLRWPAKPGDIKKRIEGLIDREYMERDSDDAQVYNYLA